MNTNDFALAVCKVRTLESDTLVSHLQEVFMLVTRLTAEEVVANYQMLGLLEEAFEEEAGKLYIKHLRGAMVVRMQVLVIEANPGERTKRVTIFERTTNQKFRLA